MIPTANLARLLAQTARRLPDAPGLIWRDRRWNWRELDERASRLATALQLRGVGPGDRVLVHSRNTSAMFESVWGCWKAGAAWVPTNVRLTPPEVAFLARRSGAALMIRDRGFQAHARAAAVPRVLAVEDAAADEEDYEAALRAAPPLPVDAEAAVRPDHPAWFFFTSGTTGRPKAAVLSHGQLNFVVTNHLADLLPGLSERDASLVVAPLSHGAGIHALAQVARGAPSILLPGERLDTAEAWRLVERHGVSNMFTVPTILNLLVDDPAAAPHALRHVVYAGAPMYRSDQKRALRVLGPCLVQYFGLGEVTGNITVLRADQHSPDDAAPGALSCGQPRTGMEIAILDSDGTRCGPGETGEIAVRGPAVFAGYWNDPEANAHAFRHDWFHTGDLGHLDAHGFLHITGRASDMFISGGSNIYPREVEEAVLLHPDVAECAVVGLPHPRWGEAGVACVVPRPGAALEPAVVIAHLTPLLARYKHPQRVVIWEALPRSAYGKVPKSLLRERLQAEGVRFTAPPDATP